MENMLSLYPAIIKMAISDVTSRDAGIKEKEDAAVFLCGKGFKEVSAKFGIEDGKVEYLREEVLKSLPDKGKGIKKLYITKMIEMAETRKDAMDVMTNKRINKYCEQVGTNIKREVAKCLANRKNLPLVALYPNLYGREDYLKSII